jgi:type IV pilus assembly protein PilA
VRSVAVSGDGLITVTFSSMDPGIHAKTLVLTPSDVGGAMTWGCDSGSTLGDQYLPADCR